MIKVNPFMNKPHVGATFEIELKNEVFTIEKFLIMVMNVNQDIWIYFFLYYQLKSYFPNVNEPFST